MADRYYDIVLDCGCMISLDGGGGVIPCSYGYGCGKKFVLNGKKVECNEHHECPECQEQNKKCAKAWDKYRKSKEYKEHQKEIVRRNQ